MSVIESAMQGGLPRSEIEDAFSTACKRANENAGIYPNARFNLAHLHLSGRLSDRPINYQQGNPHRILTKIELPCDIKEINEIEALRKRMYENLEGDEGLKFVSLRLDSKVRVARFLNGAHLSKCIYDDIFSSYESLLSDAACSCDSHSPY